MRHVLSAVVQNVPGVLAHISGMLASRGYNIDSLTVAPVESGGARSRINIVTSGTEMVIEQIKAQLDRLVPVHRVADLSREGPHIAREMALIKVTGIGEKRVEALRLADVFRAKVIDAKTDSFVFEVTGNTDKVQTFIGLMESLGLVDVGRTGVVAMSRGGEALLASVGCYQLEGEGAQLFERIEGDYFAILGLPLLPLLSVCSLDCTHVRRRRRSSTAEMRASTRSRENGLVSTSSAPLGPV